MGAIVAKLLGVVLFFRDDVVRETAWKAPQRRLAAPAAGKRSEAGKSQMPIDLETEDICSLGRD
jgi:hypothetical protein